MIFDSQYSKCGVKQKKIVFSEKSDLEKAISQIITTMNVFKAQLGGYIQLPRIIMRKVPTHKIHGNKYREFKRKSPNAVVSTQAYTDKV